MAEAPNILLIVVDQQRYDCLGYAGGRPVETPHLDALAAQGAWFDHAYCHIPICSPSRQSFIHGRRPEAFGAHWNYDLGSRVGALTPAQYAWPRELSKLSYQSAYVGKWHVSPHGDPTNFGYDAYVPESDYANYRRTRYPDIHYTAGFVGERDPIPLEDTNTHVMARWACDKIEAFSREDRPWHVRLDFSGPHLPCRPAGRFAQMYAPKDIAPWDSFAETFLNKPYIQHQQLVSWGIENCTWDDFAPIVSRYFGMISQIDDAIGQVLKTLDDVGTSSNTMVIYTSDHGDLCGAHRMLDKHYVLYDDVLRVPLIIRWPGKIQLGLCIEQFVYHFLDLPPTLLDVLNITTDAEFHGRSLRPLLFGEEETDWRSDVVATYHGQQFGLYSQRMIRTDRWKYIWNATDVDELYNLESDPAELSNVIHEPGLAGIVKELREHLYVQLIAQGDRLLDNEWVRRQLLHGRKL